MKASSIFYATSLACGIIGFALYCALFLGYDSDINPKHPMIALTAQGVFMVLMVISLKKNG